MEAGPFHRLNGSTEPIRKPRYTVLTKSQATALALLMAAILALPLPAEAQSQRTKNTVGGTVVGLGWSTLYPAVTAQKQEPSSVPSLAIVRSAKATLHVPHAVEEMR